MKKNRVMIIWILIGVMIVILISSTSLFLYSNEKNFNNENIVDNGEISNLNNKNLKFEEEIIGTTSYGQVIKSGPYGNSNSPVKIAYIIGVHPQESKIHSIFLESFKGKSNLSYSYYIYIVNVSQDINSYEKGRMNGQLLANKYIVDDIIKNNFDLAIDIHSNEGNWEKNQFIFAPSDKGMSKNIAIEIVEKMPWLSYYNPPNPTSPSYLTSPLIEKGVPSIIYEEFANTPLNKMKTNIEEFINIVDGLNIK